MGGDAFDNRDLRAAFRAEVRRSTQATAVTAGLLAIVCMPGWVGFDYLVDPTHAADFGEVRLFLELPLVGLWLTLFTGFGRRYPELVVLLLLGLIQVAIAYMISRIDNAYAPYTLGMSLVLFGSCFLLVWPWQYTAALIGLSWLALAGAIATAPVALGGAALGTIGFYLGTASLVAFFGQFHRQLTARQEFRSRRELEHEQERSGELLSQLQRLSLEDPLTGLANRRSWDESLAREFERARRHDSNLAVLVCDVDRLKEVNDRFGHAMGDRLLKGAADVLQARVRASDLAARLSGDEFAVLCPDTDLDSACRLAEELRVRLGELRASETAEPGVTVSIGVAGREPADRSPTELMVRADNRLYQAKSVRNAVWSAERVTVAAGD